MAEYRAFIHDPVALHHTVLIGHDSHIWRYTTILEGTQIGQRCMIADCVSIGRRCMIGDDVRIQHGTAIPDGTVIESGVFIGSNVSFADTSYPNDRATAVHRPPMICQGASIGNNASLSPGVIVGAGAQVGHGAVVTRDIPPGAIVVGNPAHIRTPRAVKVPKGLSYG